MEERYQRKNSYSLYNRLKRRIIALNINLLSAFFLTNYNIIL